MPLPVCLTAVGGSGQYFVRGDLEVKTTLDQDSVENSDHLQCKLVLPQVIAHLEDDCIQLRAPGLAEHQFAWQRRRFEYFAPISNDQGQEEEGLYANCICGSVENLQRSSVCANTGRVLLLPFAERT